jgi:hypothetical protein
MEFGISPWVGGLSLVGGGASVWDTMSLSASATGAPGYGFSLMPSAMSFPTFGFGSPRMSYWGSPDFRGVADIAIGSNDLQRGTSWLGLGGSPSLGWGMGFPFMMGASMFMPFGLMNMGGLMEQLARNIGPSSAQPTSYAGGSSYAPPPQLAPEPVSKKSEPDVGKSEDKKADGGKAEEAPAAETGGSKKAGKVVDEAKVRRDFHVPGVKVVSVTEDGRVRVTPEEGFDAATAKQNLASALPALHRNGVKEVMVGETSTAGIPVRVRTGRKDVPVMEGTGAARTQKKDAAGKLMTKKVPVYGFNSKAILNALTAAAPKKTAEAAPPLPPAPPVQPPTPTPVPAPPAGNAAAGGADQSIAAIGGPRQKWFMAFKKALKKDIPTMKPAIRDDDSYVFTVPVARNARTSVVRKVHVAIAKAQQAASVIPAADARPIELTLTGDGATNVAQVLNADIAANRIRTPAGFVTIVRKKT